MGNTLSCASDNQRLRKSKSKFNSLERYHKRSAEMNSKDSEKLKCDNKLRKITDNSDKRTNLIEKKIGFDDGIEKVRKIIKIFYFFF